MVRFFQNAWLQMYMFGRLGEECSDWLPIFEIVCAMIGGEKFSIIVLQLLKHYIRLQRTLGSCAGRRCAEFCTRMGLLRVLHHYKLRWCNTLKKM